MKVDSHERARLLVDEALVARISAEDIRWLERHTEECAACRCHRELSGRIVSGLQSLSFETDPEMSARVKNAISVQRTSRRMSRWLLAAAASLILASGPVLYHLREIRQERADAHLTENVESRLARMVPAAMEPLNGGTQ